jgi:hypothetical protein
LLTSFMRSGLVFSVFWPSGVRVLSRIYFAMVSP